MRQKRFGSSTAVTVFLLIFTLALLFPLSARAAVPGLDLFNNGFGVSTWTFNNNGTQVTGILHGVWVVDHDNDISGDGSSHIVTVTYPGGGCHQSIDAALLVWFQRMLLRILRRRSRPEQFDPL